MIGWIALTPVDPAAIGAAVYWASGAALAYGAYDSSRRVHRFEGIRTQLALQAGPPADACRLLAAASAVDPFIKKLGDGEVRQFVTSLSAVIVAHSGRSSV